MRYFLRIMGFVRIVAACMIFSFPSAQSIKSDSGQEVPQHDAAAVIKLVTVRVLDQNGRPVTDLNKEDFVLYENGRQRVITEFEIHNLGESGMEVRSTAPALRMSETVQGMNRRIFIYLDIQGSDATGMANAKDAALHFVATQLKPGDEVGIIGFSPMRGFFIQEYLTTDHEKIRSAVEKTKDIEVKPSAGFISGGVDDSIPADARLSAKDRAAGMTGNSVDVDMDRRVVTATSGAVSVPGSSKFHRQDFAPRMSDLAQALKYMPGNKSLMFFSSRNLGPASKKLGQEFATASTPVYTVNTKNWIVKGLISLSIKEKYIWHDHPLKELSLASGGKYFADIEDVETISREVQALTGNYYVLGYYIPDSWDGKYHQIKVEVKGTGLQVLTQDGYFNPKPFSRFTDFEKQLHLFDLVFSDIPTEADPLEIPVEPLFITHREDINLALLTRLEVDEQTGVPPSQTEIFAFLFNKDKEVVLKKQGEINLASFDQQIIIPYFTDQLPPGEYECRVAARDMETGRAILGKIPFILPANSEAEIVLSSPILFAAGPESPVLNLNPEKTGKNMSLSDIYKFIPGKHSVIVKYLEPEIERLLVLLPMTVASSQDSELDIYVRLFPFPESDPVDLMIETMAFLGKSGQTDILMLEFGLPELEPGEYELEIEVSNVETQARSVVRKSITRK